MATAALVLVKNFNLDTIYTTAVINHFIILCFKTCTINLTSYVSYSDKYTKAEVFPETQKQNWNTLALYLLTHWGLSDVYMCQ